MYRTRMLFGYDSKLADPLTKTQDRRSIMIRRCDYPRREGGAFNFIIIYHLTGVCGMSIIV